MKILFVTGAPGMPQMIGGSQRTSDTLIRALRDRGHDAGLVCALAGSGWTGWRGRILMKLRREHFATDRTLGYRTWRCWEPHKVLERIVQRARPDVAVVLAHSAALNAKAIAATGTPLLMAFQDVEFQEQRADLSALPAPLRGIGNSDFTANCYREEFGARVAVIHPLIDRSQYEVTNSTGRYVTFINPDAKKGLDVALALAAALPGVPFLFVEGWPLGSAERAALMARIACCPNIVFRETVEDMRTVYAETRLLLAPSHWQEGYGRVASEAQFSGIPVLGSSQGGLPEAIGDGGIALHHDAAIAEWVAAYREICGSDESYADYRDRARRYADRPALKTERQVARWEMALNSVANGGNWTEFL